ncbi:ribosome biogenesis protein ytm1 [Pseudocyphellaria aurata]|nr:ribosome biogenesis protein ytm1 [Pseudocyphellaria aurata]
MASEADRPNDTNFSLPSQVKLQLTTRHTDISLPDNTGPILVNTNFRRYALSTLVNTLLQSEKPVPLEFLVNGNFLRTSIDEYLTANGISSETTLTVEYVRAILPPVYVASFEHDDWVSAVDVLSNTSTVATWDNSAAARSPGHERILSASYDGALRVWNMSSDVLATSSPAASGQKAIKAAKFISSTNIVSSGMDRSVRVWKYDEDAEGFSAALTPQLELYGHKGSVDSLAVHQPSSKILSASTDNKIGIWSTKKSDAPEAPATLLPAANKRRKLNPTTKSGSPPQRGPLALLEAHSAPVCDVIFAPTDPTVAYSVSMDHTLRTWDLPTRTLVDTRSNPYPLFALTALPTLNLVAAGTSARHIVLIDPRTSASTVAAMTLRGHTNWAVSLAANPGSAYGLLSGSHDGCCRIWDVRASTSEKGERVGRSVFVLERESTKGAEHARERGDESKVFSVHWDERVGILSSGQDGRVQINRGVGVENPVRNQQEKDSEVG